MFRRRLSRRHRRRFKRSRLHYQRLLRRRLNYHRSRITLQDQIDLVKRRILYLQNHQTNDNATYELAIYQKIYETINNLMMEK